MMRKLSELSMSELRTISEQYWPKRCFRSEDALRTHVLALAQEIQDNLRVCDYDSVETLLKVYDWAASDCTHEPLQTAYELGALLIDVEIGWSSACNGFYEQAHLDVASASRILSIGDKRRRQQRMNPRSNSEVRYRSLGVLAAAKWEGPEYLRNEVKTPEQIVLEYSDVCEKVVAYLAAYPRTEEGRDNRVMEQLGIVGVEVATMAFRYCPELLNKLVVQFNKRHGPHLALAAGHFVKNPPLSPSAWYWDFEISKQFMSGQLTRVQLHQCNTKRLQCRRATMSEERPDQWLLKRWLRQRGWMETRIGRQFKVVGE